MLSWTLRAARRPLIYRPVVVALSALVLLTTVLVDVASAHGSTIDPMSRNYGCWKRWGSDFQNPAMATQDPMCWQAWQADPNAMWNWNGLYKEQVNNNHQAAVPDGQLCSGGLTSDGRYRALDNPGDWKAASISNNFTLKYHDQALHGATYVLIYVTKQGYNPLTTALRWSDLELVAQTGAIAPGAGTKETDPVLNGVTVSIPASAPGRTGRHIVYTIWRAAHADQNYYWCADVNFGGTTPPTTPPPTTQPPNTPTPTPTPSVVPTTPVPTTPGGTGTCTAAYAVLTQWNNGFQGEVKVTAGSRAISSWTVNWTYANGQTVGSAWNATITASGSSVTARNVSYNGNLGPNGSTTFGFLGTWNGSNAVPSVTCTAA